MIIIPAQGPVFEMFAELGVRAQGCNEKEENKGQAHRSGFEPVKLRNII
jgi:hypothetical protein